jgi:hypothetical protein
MRDPGGRVVFKNLEKTQVSDCEVNPAKLSVLGKFKRDRKSKPVTVEGNRAMDVSDLKADVGESGNHGEIEADNILPEVSRLRESMPDRVCFVCRSDRTGSC